LLIMLLVFLSGTAFAHDIRSTYIEISPNDDKQDLLNVVWKLPVFGNPNVELTPEISNIPLERDKAQIRHGSNALIYEWNISMESVDIRGQTLTIKGLDLTSTDVMVKINLEEEQVYILQPDNNSMVIGKEQKTITSIGKYIRLGIEHIMLGIDHLLFVLGLLLLSRTRWLLIKTITSFTLGHSISLALATLGFIYVPEKPLNAVIALSIVFLGWELLRSRKGRDSLTIRNPWLVSFFFGIIHGIGFAGGLINLGLPESEIPIALLFFNVGVEIGQIAFIFLILALAGSLKKMEFRSPRWSAPLPAYLIGSLAMFWFIGRIVIMF